MIESPVITGRDLCSMMRKNRCTMRELSQRMGITLCRIRRAREIGIFGANTARDWVEAITGRDPGPMTRTATATATMPERQGTRALTTNQRWVLEHLRDAGADFVASATETRWTNGEQYYLDARTGFSAYVRQRFELGNREAKD